MPRPHTDRFARTAVRILRLSAAPHPFLVYTYFSFAEPHSRSSGIAWRLLSCPSPTYAESRNRFGPFGLPCFPFELLLPTASPVSDSPLPSPPLLTSPTPLTTIRTFWSPPLSCKELRNVTGLNVETSGLAMDASARVASYLDPG
jgi:hypothetical protein